MSNDDLGLRDLSPNIIDDWERRASNRPGRELPQTATERKVIALCRAVRALRAELRKPVTCPSCDGSGLRLRGWLDCWTCKGRGWIGRPGDARKETDRG